MTYRSLLGVLATLAAAGGVGVAAALPAAADTVTEAPTVYAYTIPGSLTTDSLSLVTAPAAYPGSAPNTGEWVSETPGAGHAPPSGAALLDVAAPGDTPTLVGAGGGFGGVDASEENSGNGLILDGGQPVGFVNSDLSTITPDGQASLIEGLGGPEVDPHAGEGMTLRGGQLVTSDGTDALEICTTDGSGCSEFDMPSGSSGVSGLATSPPGGVLFTDADDALGAIAADDSVTGPWDTGHVSSLPDAIDTYVPPFTLDPTDPLNPTAPPAETWLGWSSATDGTTDEIASLPTADPSATPMIFGPAQGMPSNAAITALTVTSSGNVMFTDAANDAIGEFDVTTDTITEAPLPAGFTLPASAGAIEPGPTGDSAYFDAASGSVLAIGEVEGPDPAGSPPTGTGATTVTTDATTTTTGTSSTPPPPPPPAMTTRPSSVAMPPVHPTTAAVTAPATVTFGTLGLPAAAAVSRRGLATLKLHCSGGVCIGKLTLTLAVKEKVKRTLRGRVRTVTETKTLGLGMGTYALASGTSASVEVKLSAAGLKAITAASHHTVTAQVLVAPLKGSHGDRQLTLTGAKVSASEK